MRGEKKKEEREKERGKREREKNWLAIERTKQASNAASAYGRNHQAVIHYGLKEPHWHASERAS